MKRISLSFIFSYLKKLKQIDQVQCLSVSNKSKLPILTSSLVCDKQDKLNQKNVNITMEMPANAMEMPANAMEMPANAMLKKRIKRNYIKYIIEQAKEEMLTRYAVVMMFSILLFVLSTIHKNIPNSFPDDTYFTASSVLNFTPRGLGAYVYIKCLIYQSSTKKKTTISKLVTILYAVCYTVRFFANMNVIFTGMIYSNIELLKKNIFLNISIYGLVDSFSLSLKHCCHIYKKLALLDDIKSSNTNESRRAMILNHAFIYTNILITFIISVHQVLNFLEDVKIISLSKIFYNHISEEKLIVAIAYIALILNDIIMKSLINIEEDIKVTANSSNKTVVLKFENIFAIDNNQQIYDNETSNKLEQNSPDSTLQDTKAYPLQLCVTKEI